jgi:hypothetical protein
MNFSSPPPDVGVIQKLTEGFYHAAGKWILSDFSPWFFQLQEMYPALKLSRRQNPAARYGRANSEGAFSPEGG